MTGTLKYVTGYTGFSGAVEEQAGNYLVLHCTAAEGATITVEVVGGTKGPVTLDEDGIIILRLTENATGVQVVASLDGKTETKTFTIDGLTLTAAPAGE